MSFNIIFQIHPWILIKTGGLTETEEMTKAMNVSMNDLNQSDSGQPQDENADGGSDSKEIS